VIPLIPPWPAWGGLLIVGFSTFADRRPIIVLRAIWIFIPDSPGCGGRIPPGSLVLRNGCRHTDSYHNRHDQG
jgi:hypothetical protein